MRILVVGHSGQVARSLVEAAAPADGSIDVVAMGRPLLDITDQATVALTMAEVRPDVVINAAAYTAVDLAESEPDAAHRLNADGAGWLAREATRLGAPIIHVSTDYVFSGDGASPYLEADPTTPVSVYGASKLAGELAVAAANPRHVIVRTAWVYSPFGKNFVRTMLRLAETSDEIDVVADQHGNPTYALDIAQGLLAIAEQAVAGSGDERWGVFHMTAPDQATWAEFAQAVFAESRALGGPHARVRPITTAEYPTAAKRPMNSRLDGARLHRIYGMRLPSWRAGLSACVRRVIVT